MAEEEEVKIEVEAMQSVYGEDCVVIESYPPYLNLRIKPRTADVSSQQFVEAVVGIRASSQYPKEPPHIYLIDSKGLDEQRQTHLICSIRDKAYELPSCFMLVALCEEAVERLSSMNHPDGDCPLCLYPLMSKGGQTETLPFMKLMSCFHCFHCECILRWWNWLQIENKNNAKNPSSVTVNTGSQQDIDGPVKESMGNCPLCRKVFHVRDFEHVLDLVGTHSSQQSLDRTEVKDDERLLHSDFENIRRRKFEAILKLQQENSSLIESKKDHTVSAVTNPQNPVTLSNHASTNETTDQPRSDSGANAETVSSSSSTRPSSSKHWNSGLRKQKAPYPRKQFRQWVRKDNGGAAD